MLSTSKPSWQQVTALVSLSASGTITGFSFVPSSPADLMSPASMPISLMALERSAPPTGQGDAALRSAIVNVAQYYLRMAQAKTPAQMEAIIWQHDSIDGVDHGESCAAFASLTLELAAQVVGQQSWVTGGTSYPWPLHKWADVRVDPNPSSPDIISILQDAEEHGRWHPLGDGYQPQPGDWVLFNQHVEVVTKYSGGVLYTIGGDSLPNFSVNAHEYPAPLAEQGVVGFVNNGDLASATGRGATGSASSEAAAAGSGQAASAGSAQAAAAGSAAIPGAAAASSPSSTVPGTASAAQGASAAAASSPSSTVPGTASAAQGASAAAASSPSSTVPGTGGASVPGTGSAPVPGAAGASASRPGPAARDAAAHATRALPSIPGAPAADSAGLGATAQDAGAAIPGTAGPAPAAGHEGRGAPQGQASGGQAPGGQASSRQAGSGDAPSGEAAQPRTGQAGSGALAGADVPGTAETPSVTAATQTTSAGAAAVPGWPATPSHRLRNPRPYGRHEPSPTAAPVQMTSAHRAFINAVAPGAMATQAKYGIPAAVTIAQAIDESGWGQSILATQANNLFGIKGTGPAGSDVQPTQEYENGEWVTISAPFRAYNNISESIEDHGALLATSGYYTQAMAVRGDPNAFANALTGVYATNPDYGSDLIQLMQQYDLYRYDVPATAAAGTAAGAHATRAAHAARHAVTTTGAQSAAIPGVSAAARPPSPAETEPSRSPAPTASPSPRRTPSPAPTWSPVRAPSPAPTWSPVRAPSPSSTSSARPTPSPGSTSRPAAAQLQASRSYDSDLLAGAGVAMGAGTGEMAGRARRRQRAGTADWTGQLLSTTISSTLTAAVDPAPRLTAAAKPPGTGAAHRPRASTRRYQHRLPPSVNSDFVLKAKAPLARSELLYRDVAGSAGIGWELLAACDWMQCEARPRHSPVHGERLGTANPDGTSYRTRSEALEQCARDLIELAGAVYGIDLTAADPLCVGDLAKVFAAFRWGGLLKLHHTSAMEFPYSVAGLTVEHLNMRWPNIGQANAPDKPGGRFRGPFGAVPVVLRLKYPATE